MVVRDVRARRPGVAAVETALVMVLMTTVVFGVFEYCRVLMDLNMLNNAAREGCRHALANNTSPSITANVQTIVTVYMGSEAANFANLTVTLSGTHNGAPTAVNNLSAGDLISVTVSGNYKFMNIIPLIAMPAALPLSTSVTMGCEGAT